MRTVHNIRMVSHVWATQSQQQAKNSGGTFYFDGPTIYSYGTHFPVARIVTNRKGQTAALFNPGSYSKTTSSHQSMARRAVSHLTQFTVPQLGDKWGGVKPSHPDNLRYYKERIHEAAVAFRRARLNKEWRLANLEKLVTEANAYATFFGLRTRFEVPSDKEIQAVLQKARQQAELKRKREAERKRLAAEEAREAIEKWKAGEDGRIPWNIDEVFLRVREKDGHQVVETSKGAEVPLSHAVRILPHIRSGVSYVHNCHSIHIGHFRIDAIDADGNLKAGCHFIKREEMERVANQLGL